MDIVGKSLALNRLWGSGVGAPVPALYVDLQEDKYLVNGVSTTFDTLFTTTRATKGWDIVDGVLVEYAVNTPRRNSNGLMVEEATTNELLKSSELANSGATWLGNTSFTITAVTSFGDSLGLTAYKHTSDGVASSRNRYQDIGVTTVSPETMTFIVENVDAAFTHIGIYDVAQGHICLASFDWSTKAMAIVNSAYGSAEVLTATLLAMVGPNGGELYELSITATPTTAGNTRRIYIYPSGLGVNTDSVIIHHAQHCELDHVTSPILTDTTAVTRNADVIVNNAAITDWYNESEGTIFVDANTKTTGTHKLVQFDDGADTVNRHLIFDVTTSLFATSNTSSVQQVSMTKVSPTLSAGVKVAYAYKLNDYEGYINSAVFGTDASATVPLGISELHLGSGHSGDSALNGYIQEFKYYNTRLTQAQMITLTTV